MASSQSKRHNATMIDGKVITRFFEQGSAYLSVTNWGRRLRFGEQILEPGIHSGFLILTPITAFLRHGVPTLASTFKISPSSR
jgi:hypothetical protein